MVPLKNEVTGGGRRSWFHEQRDDREFILAMLQQRCLGTGCLEGLLSRLICEQRHRVRSESG